MNLFGKLWGAAGRFMGRPVPTAEVQSAPGPATLAPEEARRVATVDWRDHVDRLEREANRTGNRRLAQQARNIRARLSA